MTGKDAIRTALEGTQSVLKMYVSDLSDADLFVRPVPSANHIAWQLGSMDELRAAYRELKAMGIAVESTVEHNVTTSVYFPDPDGNRVELYCDMVADGFETMRTIGPRAVPVSLD